MSNAKLSSKTKVVKGYAGLVVAVIIASGLLLASISPDATDEFTPMTGFLLALFISLLMHAVLHVIRDSKGWNEKWNKQPGSALNWYYLLRDIVKLFTGGLVLTSFILLLGYSFVSGGEFPDLNNVFYAQIAGYLVYAVLIFPLVRALAPKFKGFNLPSYSLTHDGFKLGLNMSMGGEDASIPFTFNEIESMQLMKFQEAKSFMKHELGMNTSVGLGSVKDLFQYAQGKIERPRYYEGIQSGGVVLVLQGPELLYMVTVTGDGQDLLEAFQKSKAGE